MNIAETNPKETLTDLLLILPFAPKETLTDLLLILPCEQPLLVFYLSKFASVLIFIQLC
jgi:hypothetical protein